MQKHTWVQEWGRKGSSYQGFISASQTFRDIREKATEPRDWVTLQPRSIPTDQGMTCESPHQSTGPCAGESKSCIAREQKRESQRWWEDEDRLLLRGLVFKDGTWGRSDAIHMNDQILML